MSRERKKFVYIEVRNNFCAIESDLSSTVLFALDEKLSFFVPGYQYMPLYRKFVYSGGAPRRAWDGKKHFFQKTRQLFPTGLLPIVIKFFEDRNWEVVVQDRRAGLIDLKPIPSTKKLVRRLHTHLQLQNISRKKCWYQREAIRTLKYFSVQQLPFQRGLLSMATGVGKTIVGAILALIVPKQFQIVYTVNQVVIAKQTQEIWEKFLGEKIGFVGDGVWQPQRITVAMMQTLHKRCSEKTKSWLHQQHVWIADEAHHQDAPTYAKISEYFTQASIRVGLSGTVMQHALTKDNLSDATLHAIFGPKLYHVSASNLREEGLLSKIYVTMIHHENMPTHEKHYGAIYKAGITHDIQRNMKIVEMINHFIEKQLLTLVICERVYHCRILKRLFEQQYPNKDVAVLTGSDHTAYRQYQLTRFKEKQIFVIIASTIFDEGIDIPDAERLILASGAKGGTKGARILQRIGRISRLKTSGNHVARVYDFLDTEPRYLSRHAVQRQEIYKKEGYHLTQPITDWDIRKVV